MGRKLSGTESNIGRQLSLAGAMGEPYDLLPALFSSSMVGVAICDRQFRFRAVNDALASMNGIPVAAHLGKTIHAVVGNAAEKVLPALEHVFATGQPLSNFEVTAKLPSRDAPGHWNESYFPIKDDAGQVQQVGAVVLELTKPKDIASAVFRLAEGLTHIKAVLRNDPHALQPAGLATVGASLDEVSSGAGALLETCLLETRAISRLLHSAPRFSAVQPLHPARAGQQVMLARAGQAREFAAAEQIADRGYNALSEREREVAAYLASGKTNKQIASMLTISTRTVESHRARVMLKLGMHSLSDLVRYAVRTHLIQP
ncbi:MAG TPA: LuxR C-terminal-related transcriptional regulator [Candidatus Acidoferrum sp.]